ncbi:hypothetical protein ACIBI4_33570 [Streptomyces sp. NPDC050418]|uniref:hypothetical protein n=1 Tax=Streptomyces sp. NPDC050418 TaxID=3365612 RepID=UPI0037AD439C
MESSTIPHTRRLRTGLAGGLICVGSLLAIPYAAADPSAHEIIAPAQGPEPGAATMRPADSEPDAGFGPLGATL